MNCGSCSNCWVKRTNAGQTPPRLIALAGNPNTGKSTLFNSLTGLRQRTGNWPGKTVARLEGSFQYRSTCYRIVDLPGAYSLISSSIDEEITRDFILLNQPDCTLLVIDVTALERNLNFALQILQIAKSAVVCLNFMDEAKRKSLEVDCKSLSADLGVPVVPIVARSGKGLEELLQTVGAVIEAQVQSSQPSQELVRYSAPVVEDERSIQRRYDQAERIAQRAVRSRCRTGFEWSHRIDNVVTSRVFGLPLMLLLLAILFWITIVGANYPSRLLACALFWLEARGYNFFTFWGAPWWLSGFVWQGVFRGVAWVVSVMLPPMAIFFPLFTILEDLGYLPRVAFNLDRLFQKAGGHGKQALSMAMGFGCNAAGVISTRVIDSPRERLIAVLTNNFVPCNGRFPLLILLSIIFVATVFPPLLASFAAAAAVLILVLAGVGFTLLLSLILSSTLLKGESSTFLLELPPYPVPKWYARQTSRGVPARK